MEFMQRLAALVPRPRLHLIRFHGVLAPNAKLRSRVVPVLPQQTTQGEGDCTHEHSKPARMTWARLLKPVFDIDIEQCACGGKLKHIAVIEEPAVPSTSSGQGLKRYSRIWGWQHSRRLSHRHGGGRNCLSGLEKADGICRAEEVVWAAHRQGQKYSTK